MTTGAITPALLHIREYLESFLEPYGWELSTAENPFQKYAALQAAGDRGILIVSWRGDLPLAQAHRSLVIRASVAITLSARGNPFKPAQSKLEGDGARLFEIHDRVKGAMLAISMPEASVPEPGAEVPTYICAIWHE